MFSPSTASCAPASAPPKEDDVRLGPNFPIRLLGCETQSDNLFTCVESIAAKYTKSDPDSTAKIDLSLLPCKILIEKYDKCTSKALLEEKNKRHKKVEERVPADYRYVPSGHAAK